MPDLVWNGLRRSIATSVPADREPLAFHRSLPGYSPGPVRDVPAIAAALGVGSVLVKDESNRFGLPAFKILGASWAAFRVLRERFGDASTIEDLRGAIRGPITLLAATAGNHGRAVARVASLLGVRAHIYVPEGSSPARIEAIASEGASVTIVDGTYDDAVEVVASEASDTRIVISDTAWDGYTVVPSWIVDGYSTIMHELDDELRGRVPTLVAVQIGIGSLAAAVVGHLRRPGAATGPVIVGVEPVGAASYLASACAGSPVVVPGPHRSVMAGLNAGVPSPLAWPVVSRGVDAFVAVDDGTAMDAVRLLAENGIDAGETGAAGLAGVLRLARDADTRSRAGMDADATVLVFATEGVTDPESRRGIVAPP